MDGDQDLEKAYDRMRWSFIQDTFERMRQPTVMIDTMMKCISMCSMNILWNDIPTETFQPTRGVRHGDPLSLYIFVACMECLSHLIETKC